LKKIVITLAALVSVLGMSSSIASAAKPAEAGAGGKSAAAKACAAEKQADKAAFKETYGKHAMRNCIKGGTEEVEAAEEAVEAKNAAKECEAERAADPVAFVEQFATNANGNNAFGKCVSSKVGGDEEEEEVVAGE